MINTGRSNYVKATINFLKFSSKVKVAVENVVSRFSHKLLQVKMSLNPNKLSGECIMKELFYTRRRELSAVLQ